MQRVRALGAARARSALVSVGLTVLVGATYARLYFGVDFTDEAFYVAVPYRFVNGARPLVDEALLVQQSSAVILYPLVKVYTYVVGTEGIVLFARHLHFLFVCAVWTVVARSLRVAARSRHTPAMAGALAVTFVPFGIPALSYNTFASGFFTAGCFLALAGVVCENRRLLAFAGICAGLAIFAYPPIAVGALALVAAAWVAQGRSVGRLGVLVAPIAVLSVLALAFFLSDGLGRAVDLVHQSRLYGNQGGGAEKLVTVAEDVFDGFSYKVVAVALLLAAAALRGRTRFAWIPLVLLPVTALPADLRTSASANGFITNIGMLAVGLILIERQTRRSVEIFGLVWIPAVIAGAMTAVSSSNGAINFAIGFLPAAIATLVLLESAIRSSGVRSPAAAAATAVAVLGTLAVTVMLQFAYVYRDSGIRSLDTRVNGGPFAGLFTTAYKNQFSVRLDSDLRLASGPRCSIFFYDTFPAGYLFGQGKSDTNNTWFLSADRARSSYDMLLADYFRRRGLPDVVVRFARVPLATGEAIQLSYPESDPIERLFAGGYDRLVRRPEYMIERRHGARCRPSRR